VSYSVFLSFSTTTNLTLGTTLGGAGQGVEFYLKLLEILNSELGESSDITSEISNLEKLNFIHPAQSLSDFYQFKSVLSREVSYETILKANRKIMHHIAGDVIESEYSDRIEFFYMI